MATDSLTFVEEIVLLSLDDSTGALRSMPTLTFRYALAGALLADLAFSQRIDTDLQQLIVLNRAPTGDALLDDALAAVAASAHTRPVPHWLHYFSEQYEYLEKAALTRLVGRGILRRQETKILWVFGLRRYAEARQDESQEVRTRLAALLLGDDLPDPHDAVLCSLVAACNLAPVIFPEPQFRARAERLDLLARLDHVGREVGTSIDAVNRAIQITIPTGL